jgi:sucrose phosphorylase
VWTTFSADQVDLDYREPLVLAEAAAMVLAAARRGARIVRLFVWKEHGTTCLNHPNVHVIVQILRDVVDAVAPGTWLLTESNVPQAEGMRYLGIGDEASLVYNFALPPLLLDALMTYDATVLKRWLAEYPDPPPGTSLLNFTASHDGVGLRPVEGILPPERVDRIVAECRRRGGLVSSRARANGDAVPYEINITFASAVTNPDHADAKDATRRFLMSQAIALALRGIPAVYLSSLVAAENDIDLAEQTGHARSVNRHRFTLDELSVLEERNVLL